MTSQFLVCVCVCVCLYGAKCKVVTNLGLKKNHWAFLKIFLQHFCKFKVISGLNVSKNNKANWQRQPTGMQRIEMLWRIAPAEDAQERKSTLHDQICDCPHARYIIPSRIKEKCHVDFPIWKRWRLPGREKRGRARSQATWARVPACTALEDGSRPWTSLSCPHGEVSKISSRSVFTTRDGPKARMVLASSSKTHFSSPGGFHFPRISLSACVSWNVSLSALSLPCPRASLDLVM